MLANLMTVSGQVLTLFLLIGVGFTLRRIGKLTDKAIPDMTYLLLYIVTPCMVIDALQIEHEAGMLKQLGITALCGLFYFALAIGLSRCFFRKTPEDTRAVLRFGMIFPNLGFMGFPLVQSLLGKEALIFAAVVLVDFTLVQWTHGLILMGGRKEISWRHLVFSPGILSLTAGLILYLCNLRLPLPFANAVSFVTALNTPIAMFVLGALIAQTNIGKTFRSAPLYLVSALKLIALPLLVAVFLRLFQLPHMVYVTVVILSATPVGSTTPIFAERFGRDTGSAAQAVTLATLLSIITLPLFAAFLR